MVIRDLLEERGFPAPYTIRGRASIADLFPQGQRCGIYVLHFSDGEYYVGQSADIIRRYTQHSKIHADIEKISFKQATLSNTSISKNDA